LHERRADAAVLRFGGIPAAFVRIITVAPYSIPGGLVACAHGAYRFAPNSVYACR